MGGEKEKRSEKFKPHGKPDAEAISMQEYKRTGR